MPRYIQDGSLLRWEVFATTGRYGLPSPARIVFHCASQPDRKARAVFIDGDKADAERAVATLPDEDVRELFQRAEEVG